MAGGTGGHVYPALAVAHELRARGHDVLWMGAPDSFEARVVPQHGIPIEFVRVSGLRGKGLLKLFLAPLLIARAMLEAWAVMRRQSFTMSLFIGGLAFHGLDESYQTRVKLGVLAGSLLSDRKSNV